MLHRTTLYYMYILACIPALGTSFTTRIAPPHGHSWNSSTSHSSKERTRVSPSLQVRARSFFVSSQILSVPTSCKERKNFVLYYQNYQNPQEEDFVISAGAPSNNDNDYLPLEALLSRGGNDAKLNPPPSSNSSFSNMKGLVNPMTTSSISIPANVQTIDLPRATFEKLYWMESAYNKGEKEKDDFLDVEILSGRIAIVLSLYFYSIEILTGEGVLDQVLHWFS